MRTYIGDICSVIAQGHAFDRHVNEYSSSDYGKEIPIETREDLNDYLLVFFDDQETVGFVHPKDNMTLFYNRRDNVFACINPKDDDLGSAYRPLGGMRYWTQKTNEARKRGRVDVASSPKEVNALKDKAVKSVEMSPSGKETISRNRDLILRERRRVLDGLIDEGVMITTAKPGGTGGDPSYLVHSGSQDVLKIEGDNLTHYSLTEIPENQRLLSVASLIREQSDPGVVEKVTQDVPVEYKAGAAYFVCDNELEAFRSKAKRNIGNYENKNLSKMQTREALRSLGISAEEAEIYNKVSNVEDVELDDGVKLLVDLKGMIESSTGEDLTEGMKLFQEFTVDPQNVQTVRSVRKLPYSGDQDATLMLSNIYNGQDRFGDNFTGSVRFFSEYDAREEVGEEFTADFSDECTL